MSPTPPRARPAVRKFPGLPSMLALLLAVAGCAGTQTAAAPQISAEQRLNLAQEAEKSGDIGLAAAMYSAAAQAAPGNATLQLRDADFLVRRGDFAAAYALLRDRLGDADHPRRLRQAMAAIDTLRGDPTRALVEYERLARTAPHDAGLLTDKAVALDLLGRHTTAQALYRQALARSPDDPAVINDLALSLLLSGQRRQALALVATIADRTDLSPRVRNGLGIVLAANDKPDTIAGGNSADLARLAQAFRAPGPDIAP